MCSLIKILYLHTFIICHVCMIVSCRWHNVLPIAEDKYIVNLDLTFSEQNSCCLKAWHAHEIDRSSERLRDFIPIFISLVRRVQLKGNGLNIGQFFPRFIMFTMLQLGIFNSQPKFKFYSSCLYWIKILEKHWANISNCNTLHIH